MDGLRGYILTVVLSAIVCAVVVTLLPGNMGRQRMMRMICGFFLLVSVCKPIGDLGFFMGEDTIEDYRQEAKDIEDAIQVQVDEEMMAVIRQQTETYIEDKAEAMGAVLGVTVTLDDEMLPWQVELTGEVSPYVKTRLTQVISLDLEIPDERQVWRP